MLIYRVYLDIYIYNPFLELPSRKGGSCYMQIVCARDLELLLSTRCMNVYLQQKVLTRHVHNNTTRGGAAGRVLSDHASRICLRQLENTGGIKIHLGERHLARATRTRRSSKRCSTGGVGDLDILCRNHHRRYISHACMQ